MCKGLFPEETFWSFPKEMFSDVCLDGLDIYSKKKTALFLWWRFVYSIKKYTESDRERKLLDNFDFLVSLKFSVLWFFILFLLESLRKFWRKALKTFFYFFFRFFNKWFITLTVLNYFLFLKEEISSWLVICHLKPINHFRPED